MQNRYEVELHYANGEAEYFEFPNLGAATQLYRTYAEALQPGMEVQLNDLETGKTLKGKSHGE